MVKVAHQNLDDKGLLFVLLITVKAVKSWWCELKLLGSGG
jgi:hypothetical protein